MNVVDLLANLAKLDIRLWLEGENLRFNAPEGVFTAEIREQVVSRKAEIITFLKQARKLNEQPIPMVGRDGPLPVSYSQQRLWVLDRLNPRDVTYNMTSALRIRGPLNFAVLEKVFATLVQRHEALRTRFVEVDGEPFQVIDPFNGWQLAQVDCAALPQDQHEQRVQDAVNEFALTPYNLSTGPLFRAQVLTLSADYHVLIAGMHHIISDAWSMEVMVKEIGVLYFAFSAGMSSPLPPLTIQYADFAAWQRDQINAAEMEKHQQYWVSTLTGAPPVLDIPTDRPRQDMPSNNGALYKLPVSDELASKINQAVAQHDLTPFMFFLGAWQMLLGRFANSDDVVIGAPVAGRSRAEVQEIMGFFVNLLLMRLDLSGNPSVQTVLQRVKEMVLSAFTHQDMPIDRVMEVMAFERQPGYPPLAQSMFQLLNMNEEASELLGNGDMTLEPIPAPHVTARMDLVLGVAKLNDRYELSMEYNTDLFNESTIEDMLQAYVKVLALFAAQPEQAVDSFRLRDDRELLEKLGLDSATHEILPLSPEQRALVNGCALASYVALDADADMAAVQGAVQSLADQLPWLRARLVSCDLRAADRAYWVIPDTAMLFGQPWRCEGNDVADLEQALLNLSPLQGQGVAFSCATLGNGQQYLVVRALKGLLDGVSLQKLLQAILAGAPGKSLAALQPKPARRDTAKTADSANAWIATLRDVEPLHFSRPADAARDSRRGYEPRVECVQLDFRQRDAIAEFCAGRDLDVAGYFRLLYSLMLHHYCRPETAFAFREILPSGGDAIGFAERQRPVVTLQHLLMADASLEQWIEAFAATQNTSALSAPLLDQLLPQAVTHFRFEYHESADAGLVAPVEPGAVHLQVHNSATGLQIKLFFDTDRFASLQFLQRLLHISEQIVFGNISQVRELTFLSSGELHQLHGFANGIDETTEATVVEQFAAQATRTPDKIAVESAHIQLTYRELDVRSNQLAHLLAAKGIGPDVRVGVCLNRSADLVVSVLAVLKAGGAYVPMDPAYPRERLAFMVADSGAPLIITRSDFVEVLGSCESEQLLLDLLQDELSSRPKTALNHVPQSDHQIYVIYTSGSTGQPKGAVVCHRGESNLQHWYLSALKLGEHDRTLLISAVGFDLTQKNIFAPLLAGGTLVLPSMELFDEAELLTLMEQHQISWINCAPSALYPLVESAAANDYRALQSLRYVVLGGEPIRVNALFPWLSNVNCRAQVVNSYGPTECTDVVSWHCAERIESPQQALPIGRPVNSTQVYVLNDFLNPVVPGLAGEICVAGTGVGLGYINRPELTAAAFVENPFGAGKLYRTGDLGRYLPDGEIEYIGRKDFQIKLRGLRIELGEIEFAMKQLPDVKDALVLVRDETLLGYVVAGKGFADCDWRARLRDYLPEYMIPAAIMALETWPLTPNGKIDRKALPDAPAVGDRQMEFIAPRNETESRLAAIWQELLKRDNIGVLDDLFALGGNSLTATRILSRTNKQFSVQVSVRQLFMGPTISDLAVAVERAQQMQSIPPIVPVDHSIPQPLSFAQQRLWFLDQFEPGNLAYSMPGAFRVEGKLNVAAFEKALQTIVQRHAVLRSHVVLVDEQPRQVISQVMTSGEQWSLTVRELSDLSGAARDDRARELMAQWRQQSFDLATGPLFRVELVRFAGDDFLLLVNMHHIVSDGWSNGILMREIGILYDACLHDRPSPLPQLSIQYVDFAVWQREWLSGGELERQIGYWRHQLAGVQALNLATDFPRRADTGFDGAVFDITFDAELVAGLNRLSRQKGASLYMTLAAGFMLLLSRYSAQRDVTIGSPIANRHFEEIEPLIGCFINSLVIRADVDTAQPFEQLLAQVCKNTLDAYAHQDVPFERLVEELVTERDLQNSPLFQVMFALQNVPMETQSTIPGLKLNTMVEQNVVAKFDLSVSLLEMGDIIRGEVVYRTGLFTEATMRRMMDQYLMLLRSILANPTSEMGHLNLLSADERKRILSDWNQTHLEYDRQQTISRVFEQQAEKHGDDIALVVEGSRLTYADLNRRANQLSHYLTLQGLQPGQYVGVFCERSADMVVALLAILKSGAAYLPLDPEYPQARIRYVVEDAKPPFIVTQSALVERIADVPGEQIVLDVLRDTMEQQIEENPRLESNAAQLAYAIYTSGSTGNPKGVVIPQYAFMNFINGMQSSIGLRQQDRLLAVTSLSFDIAGLELFMPLLAGARVVLATQEESRDVEQLLRLLQQEKISFMQATPATWHMLVNEPWQPPMGFKVLCGGEPMPAALANKLLQRNVELYNVYGPTETTVWSTVYRVDAEVAGNIPIGKAIANTSVYVLDEHCQPVPVGVPGELYIGGHGVAAGYMNRPDLTAERFIANPFNDGLSDRLYRTGDLVRYRLDGNLECLGRLDHQVKIRGFRIELGEIEALLNRHENVKEGIVHYHDDAQGIKFLVGYVVTSGDVSVVDLRQFLAAKLPDYMVPTAFVFMEAMPLTPNGKVDRKALPAPQKESSGERVIVPPATDTERLILKIWQDIVGMETISVEDDFFSIGGHSLMVTQVASRMRAAFKVNLPLRALFESPTIRNIAKVVDEIRTDAGKSSAPDLVLVDRSSLLPLSFVQQQLWLLDQLDPGNPAYNIPIALRLRGELNLPAFETAFRKILNRHETLRSNFVLIDGNPQVVVRTQVEWNLEKIDLADADSAKQELRVRELTEYHSQTGFDLSRDLLIRGALLDMGLDAEGRPHHVFVGAMHHIVSDGWSLGLLVEELIQFCREETEGTPVTLPELTIQYADFAAWQRNWLQGDVLDSHITYWRERLDNEDQILNLPTDFPRPTIMTNNGGSVWRSLTDGTASAARRLAAEEGSTLFMVLLAAFQLLMSRYSGQKRINVGTPIAGREATDTEYLIGFFVNTVVMSSEISEELSFRQLLKRVKEVALSAYEHQALPFEKILEELKPRRDASRSPFFQVFLNFMNLPAQRERQAGLVIEPVIKGDANTFAKYDLNLYIGETADGLDFNMVYNGDLFRASTVERMMDDFEYLLQSLVRDSQSPMWQVNQMPVSAESWSPRLDVPIPVSAAGSPVERFLQHAHANPSAIAIQFGAQTVSYGELEQRSVCVRGWLGINGVGEGEPVAIIAQRRPELLYALLGVLRAGAVFTLIDAAYPEQRIAGVLRALEPRAVIHAGNAVAEDLDGLSPLLSDFARDHVATIDGILKNRYAACEDNHDPDKRAYIAFTSGTTGVPKGIAGTFRPIAHFVEWYLVQYQVKPDDVFSMLSGLSHDPLLRDIFVPLAVGATIAVPDQDIITQPGALLAWFGNSRITCAHLTPAMVRLMLSSESDVALPDWRLAGLGGDRLTADVVESLWATAPNVRVVNFYGATETPQVMATHVVERQVRLPSNIPVGTGIEGVQLLVLSEHMQLCPPGQCGQIAIRTPYLSEGYINASDSTSFLVNPITGDERDRIYLTGDKGRYLPDGAVECLGRVDQQIKIRGFRVEPTEIQSAIRESGIVSDAVVVAAADPRGDACLIAYVVLLEDVPGWQDLMSNELRAKLPDYMVPVAFVALDAIPLTPNGKVNRHALVADLHEIIRDRTAYVAPETDTEKRVTVIWQDVLGVEEIGVKDHFFELGGHSLLATRVVSRLREEFQVDLSLRQFFESPTIEMISMVVDSQHGRSEIAPPVQRVEPRELYPLSFAQQRLWMLDRIEQGSVAYNMPSAVLLEGHVDPELLQSVLNQIVRRHSALRTVFVEIDGEGLQKVMDEVPVVLQVDSLQQDEDAAALKARVLNEVNRPFNLSEGPLIRARLIALPARQWVLVVTLHHIIADGWSVGILINEVAALYQSAVSGVKVQLPALPVQYVDFAVWQQTWLQGEVLDRQLEYWKNQLSGLVPMELPTDKTRPPLQSYRGAHVVVSADAALTARLNNLANKNRATLFMVLMSAFNVLLARYSRSDDVVVGTPIANRSDVVVEPLIGFFVNVLAIRTHVSMDDSFAQLVQQMRQTTLDAYDHQHVPFERLIEALNIKRDLSRSPVFQVMFIQQNARDGQVVPVESMRVKPFEWEQNSAKYDLTLSVREANGTLSLDFEYCTDLFHHSSVEAMANNLVTLLAAASASPDVALGELSLLSDDVRRRVLNDLNRTASAYSPETPITRTFEDQAARYPDKVALMVAGVSWTYAELNQRANALSLHLGGLGLRSGHYVGVMCERSVEMVVSLLAILKAGGAYIPLDPEYPLSRIQYVVSDAQPAFVLTQSSVAERVPLADTQVILLDQLETGHSTAGDINPNTMPDTREPAYVIYTSGSTGNPKGVVIPQVAFINFIHGMNEAIGITPEDRLLAVTSLSFDIAGLELFMPLLAGATVVMATADEARDSEKLLSLLQNERISFMQATPATWHMLVQEDWIPAAGFKALCGGEPMPVTLANRLLESEIALYNVYGPTETTVWSTVYRVSEKVEKSVPIGRAIANTSIYILDDNLQPVPVGVPGELYIGGHGVAAGYLNREDLTEERFVANPFKDGLSDRIYRTGDLVRYLSDGNIECLGRLDHQVKIRGFRIELGEIEAILNTHPRVHEGIVHYQTDESGVKYLVGYIVSDEPIPAAEIRAFLSIKLPDYMVPTSYVFLTEMPLTPNGKVDRKALPLPDDSQHYQLEYVEPRTDLEREIAIVWEQVLGRDQVGIKDHFFEIGGHSLLAMKVISRIRQQYSIEIPVKSLFEVSTVEGMANYIENVLWLRGEQQADTDSQDDDLEELEI